MGLSIKNPINVDSSDNNSHLKQVKEDERSSILGNIEVFNGEEKEDTRPMYERVFSSLLGGAIWPQGLPMLIAMSMFNVFYASLSNLGNKFGVKNLSWNGFNFVPDDNGFHIYSEEVVKNFFNRMFGKMLKKTLDFGTTLQILETMDTLVRMTTILRHSEVYKESSDGRKFSIRDAIKEANTIFDKVHSLKYSIQDWAADDEKCEFLLSKDDIKNMQFVWDLYIVFASGELEKHASKLAEIDGNLDLYYLKVKMERISELELVTEDVLKYLQS